MISKRYPIFFGMNWAPFLLRITNDVLRIMFHISQNFP